MRLEAARKKFLHYTAGIILLITIQTCIFIALVDECTAGTDDCHVDATCTDTDLSFTCACNAGFAGDGTTNCQGIYLISWQAVIFLHRHISMLVITFALVIAVNLAS